MDRNQHKTTTYDTCRRRSKTVEGFRCVQSYLEKPVIFTSIEDLVDCLSTVFGTQVNNRDILAIGDLR